MNLELKSPRLVLVPFTPDDIDLSLELFTDPAVLEHAGGAMSEADIREKMPDWVKRGGGGCIGVWTIRDRETGEKYGSAALLPMPVEATETDYGFAPDEIPAGDIEIGYYLKRSAWGSGFATEACRRLLEFAFTKSPLEEVVANFSRENLASKRVLEKAGFNDNGTMRCYGTEGPNYRISREEWLQKHGGLRPSNQE